MKNKKILFILLIILTLAWLGSYRLKYHSWPWQRTVENKTGELQKEQPANEPKPEQPVEKTEPENSSRQNIIKDVVQKIGEISPVQPVLGGKWFVDRFWFATDQDFYQSFYVEYEDGHILRRVLLAWDGPVENPVYAVIAYFEPGENDWELKQGQDTMFGKKLELYEYDQNKKEWIKKN